MFSLHLAAFRSLLSLDQPDSSPTSFSKLLLSLPAAHLPPPFSPVNRTLILETLIWASGVLVSWFPTYLSGMFSSICRYPMFLVPHPLRGLVIRHCQQIPKSLSQMSPGCPPSLTSLWMSPRHHP